MGQAAAATRGASTLLKQRISCVAKCVVEEGKDFESCAIRCGDLGKELGPNRSFLNVLKAESCIPADWGALWCVRLWRRGAPNNVSGFDRKKERSNFREYGKQWKSCEKTLFRSIKKIGKEVLTTAPCIRLVT